MGIILMTFVSCIQLNTLRSDKKLTTKLETEFKTKTEIDLTNLNSFIWDDMLILEPYSQINRIEIKLKLDLKNIRENAIKSFESFNLIVFLEKGKSIKIVELSREIGDFENVNQIIKKENARFEKTDNGNNKIVK